MKGGLRKSTLQHCTQHSHFIKESTKPTSFDLSPVQILPSPSPAAASLPRGILYFQLPTFYSNVYCNLTSEPHHILSSASESCLLPSNKVPLSLFHLIEDKMNILSDAFPSDIIDKDLIPSTKIQKAFHVSLLLHISLFFCLTCHSSLRKYSVVIPYSMFSKKTIDIFYGSIDIICKSMVYYCFHY